MVNEQLKSMKREGIQLMVKGYAWAEAVLQVLRKKKDWDPSPYQWATTGYSGAIGSGRTICGALFGGTVFLGYLHGTNATHAPDVDDERRTQAITSVNKLFQGFIESFGDTDCQNLTGCNFSIKEDQDRYMKEEVYKDKCFHYFEYVLAQCLDEMEKGM